MTKWIKCSERLPSEYQTVLTNSCGRFVVAYFLRSAIFIVPPDDEDYEGKVVKIDDSKYEVNNPMFLVKVDQDHFHRIKDVTHWAEIEPPEAE